MPELRIARRNNLAQEVYGRIFRAILNGSLPPGTPLSRRRLAAELGVSGLPVGLALERLAVEGFVETKPRAGSRVKIPTAGEIRGNYIVREALEVEAARLFAQGASPAQKRRLLELAARLDARYARLEAGGGGAEVVRTEQAHVAFHLFIARATRCPELVEAIVRSRVLMFNWLFSRTAFPEPLPSDWHVRLARVLASGTPDEAEAAMREHVRFRMEEIVQRFARLRRRMASVNGMPRAPRPSSSTP